MTATSATSPGTMADDASVGTVAWSNVDNAKVSDNVKTTGHSDINGVTPKDTSVKIVKSDGTFGSFNGTLKVAGSIGDLDGDSPNFGATVAVANPWGFLDAVDLSDNSDIPGDTGIVSAGTDIYKNIEINVNTQKFITLLPVAWSVGAITAKVILTNNK